MFIITGGLHPWTADLRRQNRRPATRDGIANSSGDRPSMQDSVRLGAGSLCLQGGWPTPSLLPQMSVPLFPAGRDLLEFSRDREDDVLLSTTTTRIWPTNNIASATCGPPGRDPARPGQFAE